MVFFCAGYCVLSLCVCCVLFVLCVVSVGMGVLFVCVLSLCVCCLVCVLCVCVVCMCVVCIVSVLYGCVCCASYLCYGTVCVGCAWVYARGNKFGFCERGSEGYESKRDWFFFYSILYVYINIRTNKI